ncbi:MAG: metallophosphoesterase [Peristeroidobacter soli]
MEKTAISIKTRVAYPRKATAGATYLVSIDLDHLVAPEEWPYDDEEYPVTCILDTGAFFDQEAEGDPTIIVHRFGGSYGPARFWVTAREPPEDRADRPCFAPKINLLLIDGVGRPIYSKAFNDIEIAPGAEQPNVRVKPKPVPVTRQRTVAQEAKSEQPALRWLHLGDLHFNSYDVQSRKVIEEHILRRVEFFKETVDFIFVSGDLSTTGQPDELARASAFLDRLGERIANVQKSACEILCVPGNHDRSKDLISLLPSSEEWSGSEKFRHDFWAEKKMREGVVRAFRNYSARPMTQTLATREGLLPGDAMFSRTIRGLRVGVVCLNDSFLAPPYSGRSRADVGHEQLVSVCGDLRAWASTHDFRILLTHHHPGSLRAETRRDLHEKIAPRWLFDVHMYGSSKRQETLAENIKDPSGRSAGLDTGRLDGKPGQGYVLGQAAWHGEDLSIVLDHVAESKASRDIARVRHESLRLGHVLTPRSPLIQLPDYSEAPIQRRYALMVQAHHVEPKLTLPSVNVLTGSLQAAGFETTELRGDYVSRSVVLNEVQRLLALSGREDLIVFCFSGHEVRTAEGSTTFLLEESTSVKTRAVTLDELFALAESNNRRFLVMGEYSHALNDPPSMCGFIGSMNNKNPRESADAQRVVANALSTASGEPMTIEEFATVVDTEIGKRGGAEGGQRNWSLGSELSALLIAQPQKERNPKLRPDSPRKRPSMGFDSFFLTDFPVDLPRVTAKNSPPAPLIAYEHFSVLPNLQRRMAWFGAVNADFKRRNITFDNIDYEQFRYDKRLPKEDQLNEKLFTRSLFERSRLVKKTLPSWGTDAQVRRAFAATGNYTNLMPLVAPANRSLLWIGLPDYILGGHAVDQRMSMFSGPWFSADDPTYRDVQIPAACWRVFAFVNHQRLPAVAAFLTFQVRDYVRYGDKMPRFRLKLPRAPLVTRVPLVTLGQITGLDFGNLIEHDLSAWEAAFPDKGPIPGTLVKNLESAVPPWPRVSADAEP